MSIVLLWCRVKANFMSAWTQLNKSNAFLIGLPMLEPSKHNWWAFRVSPEWASERVVNHRVTSASCFLFMEHRSPWHVMWVMFVCGKIFSRCWGRRETWGWIDFKWVSGSIRVLVTRKMQLKVRRSQRTFTTLETVVETNPRLNQFSSFHTLAAKLTRNFHTNVRAAKYLASLMLNCLPKNQLRDERAQNQTRQSETRVRWRSWFESAIAAVSGRKSSFSLEFPSMKLVTANPTWHDAQQWC